MNLNEVLRRWSVVADGEMSSRMLEAICYSQRQSTNTLFIQPASSTNHRHLTSVILPHFGHPPPTGDSPWHNTITPSTYQKSSSESDAI
jgi:hypothetical protein